MQYAHALISNKALCDLYSKLNNMIIKPKLLRLQSCQPNFIVSVK